MLEALRSALLRFRGSGGSVCRLFLCLCLYFFAAWSFCLFCL
jgi:hypothetical protein